MPLFRRHLSRAALGLTLVAPPDAATAAHLGSCPRCRRERARLAGTLDTARATARAAADAAVSPADLDRQRRSILERIGRLGAPGRVLTFPAPAPTVPAAIPPAADRRWVLAAAAAGLILGIAVGRLPGGRPASGTAAGVATPPASVAGVALDPRHDERLLSDVDELLTREIRPEFEALDGLTPITYEAR